MHNGKIKKMAKKYANIWKEISYLQDKEDLSEKEKKLLNQKKREANELQTKLQSL